MGCRLLKYLVMLPMFLPVIRTDGQQTMQKYVAENTNKLATIQPDSNGDTHLEAIGQAIGDARVVMLGEQDHGDAPTFLAKSRLIRYLHEKKGFNVLAFESDFFGLAEGWRRLSKDGEDIDSFVRENVFGIWTGCNTCQDLFYSYIPQTFRSAQPLQLAGVDNQVFLSYSTRQLVPWIDSVMREMELPIVNDPAYAARVLPLLDSLPKWFVRPKDTMQMGVCAAYLDTIRQQAAIRIKEDDFRLLVMDNLIAELREFRVMGIDNNAIADIRDKQMAANLAWLTDVKYKGDKLIVWAASSHLGLATGRFPGMPFDTLPTMGSEYCRNPTHREETYVMGFTSYEGRAGRLGTRIYEVRAPRAGAFEKWIDPALDYAFVDFKRYNLSYPQANEPFFLSGFGHIGSRGIWNRVFDGIIYIKNMYPCDKLSQR